MTQGERQSYQQGRRTAWLRQLESALMELGYNTDSPAQEVARLVAEREEGLIALRTLCREHGDNDWSDDTELSDIINSHLGKYLSE